MKYRLSDEELLDIVRDWAAEHLGLMPNAAQLNDYLIGMGYPFTASLYESRFGSLQSVAETTGLIYIESNRRRWAREAVSNYVKWARGKNVGGAEEAGKEVALQAGTE